MYYLSSSKNTGKKKKKKKKIQISPEELGVSHESGDLDQGHGEN